MPLIFFKLKEFYRLWHWRCTPPLTAWVCSSVTFVICDTSFISQVVYDAWHVIRENENRAMGMKPSDVPPISPCLSEELILSTVPRARCAALWLQRLGFQLVFFFVCSVALTESQWSDTIIPAILKSGNKGTPSWISQLVRHIDTHLWIMINFLQL